MTDTQERLLASYESLSEVRRNILEVLLVVYLPLVRSAAINNVYNTEILAESGDRLAYAS